MRKTGAGTKFAAALVDLFMIGGMGAIIYGVQLFSVPAAWIFGGVFCVALAVFWQLQINRDNDR